MLKALSRAASIAVPILASACSPNDARYFREGAGSDLQWSGLVEATQSEQVYVQNICTQAGLAGPLNGQYEQCLVDGQSWAIFVQAGMNDIDRRCDAYLMWLDDRRRSRTPILKQIADSGATSIGIMGLAGVGPAAITAVGLAFGYAASTFTNIDSRLLYEIEHSTIQSLVLTRQAQFRINLPKTIDNRAAAIYALRSYLRLCMPMTIETQINTTINLFERGGIAALANSQARPMIDARTVRTAVSRAEIRSAIRSGFATERLATATAQSRPTPGNRTTPLGANNDIEREIPPIKWREYKRALCVRGPELNSDEIGPETRERLSEFIAGQAWKAVSGGPNVLNARAIQQITRAARLYPSCSEPVRNAYELGVFSRMGAPEAERYIRKAAAKNGIPEDGFELRRVIKALGEHYRLELTSELTDQLWLKILSDASAGRGEGPTFH